MSQRDYAHQPKKGNVAVPKILSIIVVILLGLGLGLWLLKENAPVQPMPEFKAQTPVVSKSALPSRPEEVYSYIKDLETREVPLDKQIQVQLNAEQERKLREEEARRNQEEQLRLATEQKAKEAEITITTQPMSETTPPKPTPTTKVEAREATPEEIAAAKKAQEQKELEKAKLAEEKRKQEQKKQQELAKKSEQEKLEQAKKAEQSKPKVVATVAKPNERVANQAGRFGLQCGAFKNKAQAENMQARLAMAGYNARISSNADWNRVFIGPVGDRSAASSAQSNARSVAECVIVSM